MGRNRCGVAALVLLAALGLTWSVPARAASPIDAWDLMFWAGYYEPGQDALDGDVSFGARVGYHHGRRGMLSGEVGFVRLDGTPPGGDGDFDNTLTSFEFTYNHIFLPDRKTSLTLFAGAGYANADLTGTVSVGDFEINLFGTGEDSLILGGGAGIRANVGDNFYIRPAIRARWFEARESDPVDVELLIGFGLVLY